MTWSGRRGDWSGDNPTSRSAYPSGLSDRSFYGSHQVLRRSRALVYRLGRFGQPLVLRPLPENQRHRFVQISQCQKEYRLRRRAAKRLLCMGSFCQIGNNDAAQFGGRTLRWGMQRAVLYSGVTRGRWKNPLEVVDQSSGCEQRLDAGLAQRGDRLMLHRQNDGIERSWRQLAGEVEPIFVAARSASAMGS